MQTSKRAARPVLAFFLIMGFGIGLIALANFGKGGTLESLFVFGLVALFSLVAVWMARQSGYNPFQWFDGKLNRDDLKWFGIGLAWIFASVLGITSAFPGPVGVLIALFVGGIGLALTLYKTQNILVNIAVHASYNVLVLLASRGVFSIFGLSAFPMAASPIFVPSFAFGGLSADNLLGQIFLQVFAVASSEELLKIALATGISLFTKNLAIVFGFSTAAWAGLHGILAYPVG